MVVFDHDSFLLKCMENQGELITSKHKLVDSGHHYKKKFEPRMPSF